MNAIDILGSLLGHKQSQGGKGADALNDIFGGRTRSSQSSTSTRPADIEREAKELEDLLNVSTGRSSSSGRSTGRSPSTSSPSTSHPTATRTASPASTTSEQDRALILIRAMVGAAKADGRLDADEQEKIIKQLRNPSRDDIEFLRREFERPVDVRSFAASVPTGMEQQVYTMSLIAIDLDTSDEAKYLMELSESLRLPMEVREQIHQRMGAPSIY
ncbi:tellurite resistance TerB family protein [Roseiconus nitratireducens]|nr:DUF533 domain-containing protein [Roseiconus nitratireducens]